MASNITGVYSKKAKYTNGYWGKIQYWSTKLNEAIEAGDLRGVDSAHHKLDYFIGREWETTGPGNLTI